MARQTLQAVDEADAVLLLVDGRAGLTPQDRSIAQELRKTGRPLWLVVNKSEGLARSSMAAAEFHELGLGEPLADLGGPWRRRARSHRAGAGDVRGDEASAAPRTAAEASQDRGGRPAQRRQVHPGQRHARRGARDRLRPAGHHPRQHLHRLRARRPALHADRHGGRAPARQSRETCGEVFRGQDPAGDRGCQRGDPGARRTQEISDQDAHLAGFILEAGRALVVAVNKWDAVGEDAATQVKRDFARKLNFLDFAPRAFHVSALPARGIGAMLKSVDAAYAAAMAKLPTPKLTRALIAATTRQPPPRAGRVPPQAALCPPGRHESAADRDPWQPAGPRCRTVIAATCERCFIDAFDLPGTPVRCILQAGRESLCQAAQTRH